jgi:hypothetical protein
MDKGVDDTDLMIDFKKSLTEKDKRKKKKQKKKKKKKAILQKIGCDIFRKANSSHCQIYPSTECR